MTVDAAGGMPGDGEVAGQGETPEIDQAAPDAQVEGETPEPGEGQVDWEAEAKKWQSLSKKNEQRAKENSSAAVQLKKLQDKEKTELQLATERAEEAERRASESESNHHRMMAAAMTDLPVEAIDFLGFGTEEEITERAETLASVINNKAAEIAKRTVEAMGISWDGNGQTGSAPTARGAYELAGKAGRPVESMRAGGIPSQGGAPRTMEEVFRSMINEGPD
jgi:hypothetical protein